MSKIAEQRAPLQLAQATGNVTNPNYMYMQYATLTHLYALMMLRAGMYNSKKIDRVNLDTLLIETFLFSRHKLYILIHSADFGN